MKKFVAIYAAVVVACLVVVIWSVDTNRRIDQSFAQDVRTFSLANPANGCLYTGYAKVDPGVRYDADVATLVVEGRAQLIGALPRDPGCPV